VQFTAGEVKIFSSSLETGESEESVPSEYSGPDMEIGFNAQYLLDFLRATNQEQVLRVEGSKERRRIASGQRLNRRSLPLCGNAHANLTPI
jgi:DNA polymerase III sliding clamp (beta) subunit (PCNA family)